MKALKREVSYDGDSYKVRSDMIEIPDFTQMKRTAVLTWLNWHTYARGYSKAPSPLSGYGGTINARIVQQEREEKRT